MTEIFFVVKKGLVKVLNEAEMNQGFWAEMSYFHLTNVIPIIWKKKKRK